MVAVKETHEAGQEVNPDQKEAFVNHEGLKRVYKPKPKQQELSRVESAKFGGSPDPPAEKEIEKIEVEVQTLTEAKPDSA